MPPGTFEPWEGSVESIEAKKIVDDAVKRIDTVKADTQRITPKLSTFKKATLERLIKETKAGSDAAAKKSREYDVKSPEKSFIATIEAQERTKSRVIMQEAEAKVAAIKLESAKSIAAAKLFQTAGGGKGGRIANHLRAVD